MVLHCLKCTWWVKNHTRSVCRFIFPSKLCHLFPHMIPYFNWRLSGLDHQTSARIIEEKCLRGTEKEMHENDVSPPLIPPPLCLCMGLRQLFDLMLFPDDLSVYSSCCVVSIGHRGNSCPSVLTFFFAIFLGLVFSSLGNCVCVLYWYILHMPKSFILSLCVSLSLCLGTCLLSSQSSFSMFVYLLALQSSEPVEGSGPAGSGVSQSASRGGWVPHGAQVQERPCSEAQDPPPGTVSAATSGWPLPHWGVPWRDLWGKGKHKSSVTS